MENEVLPPEQKGNVLQNPINVNCNYGRSNKRSIGWNNLIVGSYAILDVAKAYVNVFNYISTFLKPTAPTNVITN